jgi:hypothetical protein
MLFETLMSDARQLELSANETTIQHRSQWALITRADKLERALRTVRAQLRFAPLAQ